MAYITNKERARRVRQSNQNYGIRKIIISATVVFLIVLTIFSIVTAVNITNKLAEFEGQTEMSGIEVIKALCDIPLSLFSYVDDGEAVKTTLSGFGYFMAIWSVATIGLAIASMVLMLTMKSPMAAKRNINILQGAALSGKKLEAHANATQVYRERGTNPKKLKKAGK
mgnify:CR=1 FL=1